MSKNRNAVPDFLLDVAAGHPNWPRKLQDSIDAGTIMSNWLRVHAYIRSLPVSRESLAMLAYMMVHEYLRQRGPRMDIITRLHGKFNSMRYEVERVELGNRRHR